VIAALTDKRSALLPEIPTAEEEGFQGLNISAWNAAISKALDNPALKARLDGIGLDVPEPARRTPAYLAQFVATEISRWREPVRAGGVQHN
jgi:tripartite-type tricarboxylate transporter receptor subunit TctC